MKKINYSILGLLIVCGSLAPSMAWAGIQDGPDPVGNFNSTLKVPDPRMRPRDERFIRSPKVIDPILVDERGNEEPVSESTESTDNS